MVSLLDGEMMDETGFRQHLKWAGKKAHVINSLIQHVRAFEAYLDERNRPGVDAAQAQDIHDYAGISGNAEIKDRMRALAVYYRFAGNPALSNLAGDIRAGEVTRTRPVFALNAFPGVSPEVVAALEAAGIVTVVDMLNAGSTPTARRQVCERTGAAPEAVMELVRLSDLARLPGTDSLRARLYYAAGLETPALIAQLQPEALQQVMAGLVSETGSNGPSLKEIRSAIAAARKLREVVQY